MNIKLSHTFGNRITPFLKWAGGKRWLLEKHNYLFDIKYNRYIEPFVGSGSAYFYLAPQKAILNDINSGLITTYLSIRDEWEKVFHQLKRHHRNHNRDYYYKIRAKKFKTSYEKAAQFIYLNRTCWNGLYRVNLKGQFNVPIGTKNKVILDTDDFGNISSLLKNTKILSGDFELAIGQATRGDFIFADPPYTVIHNNNGFIKYNERLFSWNDQVRLRCSIKEAISRGAKVLITNACHDSIKELYRGMGEFVILSRASMISSNRMTRGMSNEMVIKCF